MSSASVGVRLVKVSPGIYMGVSENIRVPYFRKLPHGYGQADFDHYDDDSLDQYTTNTTVHVPKPSTLHRSSNTTVHVDIRLSFSSSSCV